MKFVVLVLAILSLVSAYNKLEASNGHDILRELEGNNHNVYVVMFHAGATNGSPLAHGNDDYENALISRVLDKYPNFFYAKVDANNKDYDELVKECAIEIDQLQKSPSILIMENGNGAWIHGPQTITKLEEYAPAYNKRSQAQ